MNRLFVGLDDPTVWPAARDLEIVERKGVGHPDTLADLIADEFVRQYTAYTVAEFGVALNLNVDKVIAVGALHTFDLGVEPDLQRPGSMMLIGKITERVGSRRVPVDEIFRAAVTRIVGYAAGEVFAAGLDIHVNNRDRHTPDHGYEVYRPLAESGIRPPFRERRAADTVTIVQSAPLTLTESLAIEIERRLTGAGGDFRREFTAAGTDVKVMVVRTRDHFDITVCVPAIASRIDSPAEYDAVVEGARALVTSVCVQHGLESSVAVNSKDVGGGRYLTAYGTSLDKGDHGTVGRGNGPLGVSSAARWALSEALPGKNPFLHPAPVYNALLADTSQRLVTEWGIPSRLTVTVRNGDRLVEPHLVTVQLAPAATSLDTGQVASFVDEHLTSALADLDVLSAGIAMADPLSRFTEGDAGDLMSGGERIHVEPGHAPSR